MKLSVIKNITAGIIFAFTVMTSLPAFAATAAPMTIRIKNGYGTVYEWGQNAVKSNGIEVSAALNYDGTIYVPIGEIANDIGTDVFWNEESATLTVLGERIWNGLSAGTGPGGITMPDSRGIIYRYEIAGTDNRFLRITSVEDGSSRAYALLSPEAYRFDSDGVAFVAKEIQTPYQTGGYGNYPSQYYTLMKIPYTSGPDSQDGYKITTIAVTNGHYPQVITDFHFSGDYCYYTANDGMGSFQNTIYRKYLWDGSEAVQVYGSHNQNGLSYANGAAGIEIIKIEGGYVFFEQKSVFADAYSESTTKTMWKVSADGSGNAWQATLD